MKKILSVFVAGVAYCALSGCAIIGLPPDRVQVVDYQKMQIVDDHAKRTGMTVIWLNQPTRIVDRVASRS